MIIVFAWYMQNKLFWFFFAQNYCFYISDGHFSSAISKMKEDYFLLKEYMLWEVRIKFRSYDIPMLLTFWTFYEKMMISIVSKVTIVIHLHLLQKFWIILNV